MMIDYGYTDNRDVRCILCGCRWYRGHDCGTGCAPSCYSTNTTGWSIAANVAYTVAQPVADQDDDAAILPLPFWMQPGVCRTPRPHLWTPTPRAGRMRGVGRATKSESIGCRNYQKRGY